jgi:hypothetical protein
MNTTYMLRERTHAMGWWAALNSVEKSSKFGICFLEGAPLHPRRLQPGAGHSSFGVRALIDIGAPSRVQAVDDAGTAPGGATVKRATLGHRGRSADPRHHRNAAALDQPEPLIESYVILPCSASSTFAISSSHNSAHRTLHAAPPPRAAAALARVPLSPPWSLLCWS